MNERTVLRNLYLLAKYSADANRYRSNDLMRKEHDENLHWQDKGLADAYEAIVFYLQRPELIEGMDYNKIMKVDNMVPNWLKE